MKLRINVKRKKEDCLRVEFGSKNQRETIDSHFFNYIFSRKNSERWELLMVSTRKLCRLSRIIAMELEERGIMTEQKYFLFSAFWERELCSTNVNREK